MNDARAIKACRLVDGDVALSVLNLGAITQGWWLVTKGEERPLVLGYRDPQAYLVDRHFLGAIVGRVANRTANSRFELKGQTYSLSSNEGRTHLHGGARGLNRRIWHMDHDSAGRRVELRYTSPDGEEGYPGNVEFRTEIALHGHRVHYTMQAFVDRPTPINLAQHNYYNLSSTGQIWNHRLTLSADHYTPVDGDRIPTGAVENVAGTGFDFQRETLLYDNDPKQSGTDINLILKQDRDREAPVATLRTDQGLVLRMWSDQPGLQLYTGTHLEGEFETHGTQSMAPFGGLCLEPQGFPNAVNETAFPSIIVTPDKPYQQALTVEITENLA